jgi:hypothetical protein
MLSLVAEATPDAHAVLAESDAVRNPARPYSVTVSLSEYRSSKLVDSSTLTVYAKADSANGQYRNLVRFALPES